MVVEVWYDFETTGLKIEEGAAAVQLCALFVVKGEVVDTLNEKINPFSYKRPVTISKIALEINGNKEEDFPSYRDVNEVVRELKNKAYTWGSKYKTKCKLIGYNNSTFDKYFIEEMFVNAELNFSSYFDWKQIDVFELVKALQFMGVMGTTFNQKLGTIAEYFKLETEGKLHDAFNDVELTRGIYLKIKEVLNG